MYSVEIRINNHTFYEHQNPLIMIFLYFSDELEILTSKSWYFPSFQILSESQANLAGTSPALRPAGAGPNRLVGCCTRV
jgi:hypothetical protein